MRRDPSSGLKLCKRKRSASAFADVVNPAAPTRGALAAFTRTASPRIATDFDAASESCITRIITHVITRQSSPTRHRIARARAHSRVRGARQTLKPQNAIIHRHRHRPRAHPRIHASTHPNANENNPVHRVVVAFAERTVDIVDVKAMDASERLSASHCAGADATPRRLSYTFTRKPIVYPMFTP